MNMRHGPETGLMLPTNGAVKKEEEFIYHKYTQGRRKQIISGGHKFRRKAPEKIFFAPPPEFWGSNELAVVIGLSKAKHIYKHSHVGELVTVLYKRNKLDNYNKIYY